MNADTFVIKLAECAIPIEKWIEDGATEDLAVELYESYFFKPKSPSSERNEDPILDLIARYDTSKFNCRDIQFDTSYLKYIGIQKTLGRELKRTGKIAIGNEESDYLVLNPKNSNIELLDHAKPDFVIAVCAINSSRFLDALFHLVMFELPYSPFVNELNKHQLSVNNDARHKRARECAELAGGDPGWYRNSLGCDIWI